MLFNIFKGAQGSIVVDVFDTNRHVLLLCC